MRPVRRDPSAVEAIAAPCEAPFALATTPVWSPNILIALPPCLFNLPTNPAVARETDHADTTMAPSAARVCDTAHRPARAAWRDRAPALTRVLRFAVVARPQHVAP